MTPGKAHLQVGSRVLRLGDGSRWQKEGSCTQGATKEVPSQEGQQAPRRGWAQGAGGQGSRWQDTEPSRQRQRLQGSPGWKKCSWWRMGTVFPDCGQPAGASEERVRHIIRGKRSRGEGWLRERCLPGHCGQQSPGVRTGCGQDSGGQRRARHCTLPLCVRKHTPNEAKSGLVRSGPHPLCISHPL